MRYLAFIVFVLMLAATAQAQSRAGALAAPAPQAAASALGTWVTEGGKSRVAVAQCGEGLCANIVWLKDPNDNKGQAHTDVLNSNRSLRKRPIIGLPLFENMRPKAASRWTGRIYNPEDGESFDVDVWVHGHDQIKIKGCVLFICETHTWKRAPADAQASPAPLVR